MNYTPARDERGLTGICAGCGHPLRLHLWTGRGHACPSFDLMPAATHEYPLVGGDAEIDRLRAGLLACAEAAGEDVSDGIPSWPDVVEWAVRAVREGRRESEDAVEAAEGKLADAIEVLEFYGDERIYFYDVYTGPPSAVSADRGGRARVTLARLRSGEKSAAQTGIIGAPNKRPGDAPTSRGMATGGMS